MIIVNETDFDLTGFFFYRYALFVYTKDTDFCVILYTVILQILLLILRVPMESFGSSLSL